MSELSQYVKAQAADRPVGDILADILRKRIMDGEYLPGERLVEADLTKLYGVSRGPIREAIRRLVAEGLVNAEKHHSPTIRGIDQQRFMEMFELRGVLEGYACALAARNAARLRARDELLEQAELWRSGTYCETPARFVQENQRLHERLIALAERPMLREQIRALEIPGYRVLFFQHMLVPEEMELSARDHASILELVVQSNEAGAEARMRQHVHSAGTRIGARYTEQFFDRRLRELNRLKGQANTA